MAIQTAEDARIEADLAKLESGIRQLQVQYQMFFSGALKREPFELRHSLEKLVKRYSEARIQKYHHRFHLNTLVARYNTLRERTVKTMRAHEETGRAAAMASKPTLREDRPQNKLLARCRIPDDRVDPEKLRDVYESFVEARNKGGNNKELSFDRFVRGVASQAGRLRKDAGCAEIELRVVVKDDKVQLEARPCD